MIAFQIKCSLFSDSMWFATHILPWLLEAGPPYIFSFQLFSVSNLSKTKSKIKTTAHEETQVAWGRSVVATICLSHLFPNILYNRLNKPRQNIGDLSIWLKNFWYQMERGPPLSVANYYRFASRQHATHPKQQPLCVVEERALFCDWNTCFCYVFPSLPSLDS